MRQLHILAALCALCAVSCTSTDLLDPVDHLADYVTTLVGTQSDDALSTGNTYPAIAVPWGMNFWTPMTSDAAGRWIYSYKSNRIKGFKQVHQPSPWIGDYGCFAIMPVTGPRLDENGADRSASWFSHKREIARPYYYNVYLADHDITVELTASERAAIMRITVPETDDARILLDAVKGTVVTGCDGSTVTGESTFNNGGVPENFRCWYVISSDLPVSVGESSEDGRRGELLLGHTDRGQQLILRMASSFISAEQAVRNLGELGSLSFDEARDAARDAWDAALGRIRVSGGTFDQMRTFYSCLYRSLLFPRKFYEIDPQGRPYHYSPYNGEVREGYMYTDNGFWDTFRAQLPLLNLVYPETSREIQAGLAEAARENDFLPEWASPGHRGCMIGNTSASVVADAAVCGNSSSREDLELLYAALVHASENVHPRISSVGRLGCEGYNSLGYVPYDCGINESVARTLEYAYDDWCMLQLSRLLDRPADEQQKWASRCLNYRNVFDPSSNLMRGRNADGSFMEPFNPFKWGDAFTEGNAWHYTWSVFHDPRGLAELMGGECNMTQKLDSVFLLPPIYDGSYYSWAGNSGRIHEITEMQVADMGNYAHGNQPAQHMLYLYDWTGQPWKGQAHIRRALDELYRATPDGYCGDEDNGQTSAWYVFSALGFYPVCPASGQYALGAPLFRRAELSLPGGKTLKIKAPANGPGIPYVRSMRVNGRRWSRNYLDFNVIRKGGRIRFDMSAEPDTLRGTAPGDRPYSFSD